MPSNQQRQPSRTTRRRPHNLLIQKTIEFAHRRHSGSILMVALFAATGLYGIAQGGAYTAYIQREGTIPDQIAKAFGFAIKAVTITGARELTENEILTLAGVSPRNSLVFLNVADLRARLKAVPLIKDASVSKLFPNRLLIEVEERQPYALWQKDGSISIVAADGTVIDDLHDPRYENLPLVTGEGANGKIADYTALLDAAGDLRPRIRAGIYVAGRRWTLKTNGGVEIALPEKEPALALSRLALVEHDSHILEKDILSIDLRIPGRIVARLTEDAASTRNAALAKKSKVKGAQT
jgi:cell division protein FtsQ